jgi:hypothetical protein
MIEKLTDLSDAAIAAMLDGTDVIGTVLAYNGSRPLVAGDRCERCGAGAIIRVTLANGEEWLYCVHHFAEANQEKLKAAGAVIYTDNAALDAQVRQTET